MKVLEVLCTRLEQRYLRLKTQPAVIRADYLQQLYRYQEWHHFIEMDKGHAFLAQIIGVRENGKLSMQLRDGSLRDFDLKEVKFV